MTSALLALSIYAQAPVDCSLEAESYVTKGYSQPGEYQANDQIGNLVYHVRTNEHGGDVAYEVVVKRDDCTLVRSRVLWSE
jgi:hypothetical protein